MKKIISCILVLALIFSSGMNTAGVQAKTKTPKLSKSSITLKKGSSKAVKLQNVPAKKAKKAKWSIKSGKSCVKLTVKNNRSKIKVTAIKKGRAKIQCKILGKKLLLKVKVIDGSNISGSTAVPSTVPTAPVTAVASATADPMPTSPATAMPSTETSSPAVMDVPANTPEGNVPVIPTITSSASASIDKDLDKISPSLAHDDYTLEQVIVFSRHNIRSPLSGAGSVLGDITPHEWFRWSSNPSELSLRGGVLETQMGQYFRKWLESEGLFDENYRPDGDKVSFYSNSKQRTIATAQYFSSGLLPVANSRIEYKADYDTMDAVFTPQFTFVSDTYADAVKLQISEMFSDDIAGLEDNYELLTDVIDMKDSVAWKEGRATEFKTDDTEILINNNSEPGMTGSLKTACSISDALVLQYYEEPDEKKAAFGHELRFDQWRALSEIKDTYQDVLFTAPLVAVNVANPALKQIKKEMETEGRKFSFLCGHDSNLASILTALNVEEYELPGSIEKRTSIGSKIVFSKYRSETGAEFWDVNMVYQKADQLRNLSFLGLDNPPAIYPLAFQGLDKNEDGLYKAEDFEDRLDESIQYYDEIEQVYADKEAA